MSWQTNVPCTYNSSVFVFQRTWNCVIWANPLALGACPSQMSFPLVSQRLALPRSIPEPSELESGARSCQMVQTPNPSMCYSKLLRKTWLSVHCLLWLCVCTIALPVTDHVLCIRKNVSSYIGLSPLLLTSHSLLALQIWISTGPSHGPVSLLLISHLHHPGLRPRAGQPITGKEMLLPRHQKNWWFRSFIHDGWFFSDSCSE